MDTTADYDRLRIDIRAVVDKIDKLMSREEYERRHTNLEERITKIEVDMRTMADWGGKEHKDMRTETANRFDKILERFDELKDEVLHSRSDNLRWTLGILLSFLVGIAGTVALQAFHVIHP